ncbi:MAG TPA: MJ0042-type zinc finger domain-containing protein [Xanthobacteraceae bacterium]|nr:MJ0042-type zinc finger domain-containing protein [Xanthobacteraceae bacterium]
MLIVCPSCATAYRIELSTLGAAGRSVRCARCRAVWFASVSDMAPAAIALATGQNDASAAGEPDQPAQPAEHRALAVEPDGIDVAGDGPDAPSGEATSVAIVHAPPLVPAIVQDDASALAGRAAGGPDIETLAARRARRADGTAKRRRSGRSRPGLATIILVLAAALAALLNWRATVVRVLPQTAPLFSAVGLPVNLRGLSFDSVKTTVETNEGVAVLVVEGVIANVTRRPVEVPRLRFAVRNGAGYEVYAWTAMPAQAALAPGDTMPFRSRLASPPADGQDVIVRFFNRRDVATAAN